MKTVNRLTVLILITTLFLGLLGCSASKKQKGAVIGAASGGVLGRIIGKKAGSTVVGAILGAAIGGAAGAYIGNYMDKQADEIKAEIPDANVERVGEGINIDFSSGLLFDVNRSTINPQSMQNLQKLAEVSKKYQQTHILIEGHTDSTGDSAYNLKLSEQRAQSVASYLAELGVSMNRFKIMGYGESQPIESNDIEAGRAANRRVEIAIYANDKLIQTAQAETGTP